MHSQVYTDSYNNKNQQNQNYPHNRNNYGQKATTLSIQNHDKMMRNNYHYSYSPNNAQNKNKNSNIGLSKTQQNFYQTSNQLSRQKRNFNGQSNISNINLTSQNNKSQSNQLNKFTPSIFPSTFKIMNLNKFVQQNVQIRKKLLQQLQSIKQTRANIMENQSVKGWQTETSKTQTRDTTPTRNLTGKSSNQHSRKISSQQIRNSRQQMRNKELNRLIEQKNLKQQQISQQRKILSQLQRENAQKMSYLQNLRSQTLNQSIHQTPLLKQKQQQIEYMSVEIQWLNDKNEQLRKIQNKKNQGNIFQMYQRMCRQCETIRNKNNKKSEKLKTLFEKVNKLTGKQENVNMFLMNLKV